MPLMCSARSGLQLKHCGQRSQQQAYATVLAADEPTLLCPFIMAGVERPLETVLSISIRVLLMLRGGAETHKAAFTSMLGTELRNRCGFHCLM